MKLKLLNSLLIVIIATMVSCKYDQVEPEIPDIPDPDIPTSFATDIQPIFTASCIACHPPTAGLNLTEGVAYGQVTQTKYLNTANPDQSLIYSYPNPSSGTHSYKKYTVTEAALVLKWIEEGALDN